MPLKPGSVLRHDVRTGPGMVKILYLSLDMASCPSERDKQCEELLVQPSVTRATTLAQRVFALISARSTSEQQTSIPAYTKGDLLPDGYAVLREHSSLELYTDRPTPRDAARSYTLQLKPQFADGTVGESVANGIHWISGTSVVAPGVTSGLYRVNLLDAAGQPSGDFFLLLVVSPEAEVQLRPLYNELLAHAETWGRENDLAARSVRRLFLLQSASALTPGR
jgi:hypothetical protein